MNKVIDKENFILQSPTTAFLVGLGFFCVFLVSCSEQKKYELSYSWAPVEITSEIKKSEEIEAIINPYKTKLDSIMDEVIGYSAKDLTTEGRYESTLGTFVTELLHKQSSAQYNTIVDVALMNHHGGLRAPINEGPVTVGEVFQVMPFENEMLLLEVPGDKLLEIIKFVGNRNSSMIWPVSFDVSGAEILNIQVDGKEIESDRTYILSVSDYQANGGSGFEMLQPLKRLDIKPILLRDMILSEIRELTARGEKINTKIANSIKVID
ncbi:5'-nucleotidase C-terminal domain-containing protein [Algoriphagus sediminis]|uniref:5'-nucleotidase C-terminal domain-containing protein n=1 Tax=Algoriphagus sediminis TaxID=3057113 RepID=A0ABT7YD13_9BACT|nr:5'-nucleotidase C-terminal domain-containing protein [Algoriphagus sediminis]MDN3204415.1 5'-nucleotidase C-terminal domain-containing protein [Algoriphagus sediminis]